MGSLKWGHNNHAEIDTDAAQGLLKNFLFFSAFVLK